jgi:predicted phage baseplate assembly protein
MPYLRPTVTLYANLALATHGETVQEDVLGSGNGSQANQSFTLHRQPLTYISAPTATGRQSTLTVRVNQVAWQEAPSIYGLDVNSQNYLVRQDEHGHTQVIFGDGIQGQRLPSGQENVVATYRVGTGLAGEVGVDALSLMPNKPLGVESVTNPLRAAGAAPRDDRDAVRLKAPRLVSTLGRIVSLQDFADFALTFGGIGKVQVAQVWNGRTRVIHLTVLGVDQQVIADNSALYNSLVKGIDAVRVPHQMVKVQSGAHLLRRFNVKARILVDAHYQSASVQAAVTDALRSTFTFTRRNFGQDVVASDLVALMQGVRGVRAVELVALYIRGCAAGLASRLEAPMARWNGTDFEPAQLLLINTEEQDGITLLLEMAHA